MSSRSSGGEHDSTGLRAELKAEHTALAVRVARQERERDGACETTQQISGKGSLGSPFLFLATMVAMTAIGTAFVTVMVTMMGPFVR